MGEAHNLLSWQYFIGLIQFGLICYTCTEHIPCAKCLWFWRWDSSTLVLLTFWFFMSTGIIIHINMIQGAAKGTEGVQGLCANGPQATGKPVADHG